MLVRRNSLARRDGDEDQRVFVGDHGDGRGAQSTGDCPHRGRMPRDITHRRGSGRAKYLITDATNDEMVVNWVSARQDSRVHGSEEKLPAVRDA